MIIKRYDDESALDWANAHQEVTWSPFRFDPTSHHFVLSIYRYDPEREVGYLVLRNPHYIRFPDYLTQVHFLSGTAALQALWLPLQPGISVEGKRVVVLQTDRHQACLIGENLSLYDISQPEERT